MKNTLDKKSRKTNKQTNEFRIAPYFKQEWRAVLVYVIISLLVATLDVFLTIYTANCLTTVTEGKYLLALKQFVFLYLACTCMQWVYYLLNFIYHKYSIIVKNKMRIDIAKQAFRISDQAYTENNTAYFTRRISQDPSTVFDQFKSITDYIIESIECVAVIGYMFYLNIVIGLIGLTLTICVIAIEYFRKKVNKRNRAKLMTLEEKSSSILNEIVRSEKDIKSLNLEDSLSDEISNRINTTSKQDMKTFIQSQLFNRSRWSLVLLFMGLIFAVSLNYLNMGPEYMVLATFMVIYTNRHYFSMFGDMVANFMDIKNEIGLARDRINELYDNKYCEQERFGNKHIDKLKGNIEFKKVYYSYNEYKERPEIDIDKERQYNRKHKIKTKVDRKTFVGKHPVLKDISFKIKRNTTVSFVGLSGSGKSTILNLVAKMMPVDKGEILLDGVNINSLDKETLRNSIAVVNQFPYIFDMTIKDNLLLAKPDASDDEIIKAIKDADLFDFVESLPEKINTKVGESGIKLSGGQKQRLAIARALLKQSSIIIFDESTSSLDNLSQNQVKHSIDNIKGKSTVIIVAHRLTTIKNVDKIFFLDNGQITDEGSFDELFERNEKFRTIFMAENLE